MVGMLGRSRMGRGIRLRGTDMFFRKFGGYKLLSLTGSHHDLDRLTSSSSYKWTPGSKSPDRSDAPDTLLVGEFVRDGELDAKQQPHPHPAGQVPARLDDAPPVFARMPMASRQQAGRIAWIYSGYRAVSRIVEGQWAGSACGGFVDVGGGEDGELV